MFRDDLLVEENTAVKGMLNGEPWTEGKSGSRFGSKEVLQGDWVVENGLRVRGNLDCGSVNGLVLPDDAVLAHTKQDIRGEWGEGPTRLG